MRLRGKVVVTAALNGALTDPIKFPGVPVTPMEMAQAQECTTVYIYHNLRIVKS